jgi:tetratricopeptide (TPR) repeat protein
VICSGLVWWLFVLIFQTPRVKPFWPYDRLHFKTVALFGALLFAVHPANTQAVTYVSQRFESLAAMFYVAAVCCYIKARVAQGNGPRVAFFITSFVSAVAAMLCKETAISLPVTILMVEMVLIRYVAPAASGKSSTGYKFPWLLLIPIGALILIIPSFFGFKFISMLFGDRLSGSHDGDLFTAGQYMLTEARAFAVFVRLLFFPINQNIDYDFPKSQDIFNPFTTFLSILFMIALFAGSLRLKRNHILPAFGIWWLFITLGVNFIPRNHVIFEHKLYLGGIGMMLGFAALVAALVRTKKVAMGILIAAVAVMAVVAVHRNMIWKDELSLWTDSVKKAPGKYTSNLNLGRALYDLGRLDEAYEYFDRAVKIHPAGFKALSNRGVIKIRRKDYEGSLKDFNAALAVDPNFLDALNNRGNWYREMKQYDKALVDLNKAIELKPFYAAAFLSRGQVYAAMGKKDEAVRDFSESIRLRPRDAFAYGNRALVYFNQKKHDLALKDFDTAIALSPREMMYYVNRGSLFSEQQQFARAIEEYKKAMAIDPNIPETYFNLALDSSRLQRYDDAFDAYQKALALSPNFLPAYVNRGNLYLQLKKFDLAEADYKKAYSLDPNHQLVLRGFASLYFQTGDTANYNRITAEMRQKGIPVSVQSNGPATKSANTINRP